MSDVFFHKVLKLKGDFIMEWLSTSHTFVYEANKKLRNKGYLVQGRMNYYAVVHYGEVVGTFKTFIEAYVEATVLAGIEKEKCVELTTWVYKNKII